MGAGLTAFVTSGFLNADAHLEASGSDVGQSGNLAVVRSSGLRDGLKAGETPVILN